MRSLVIFLAVKLRHVFSLAPHFVQKHAHFSPSPWFCSIIRTLFISPDEQSWQYPPQETCSTPWARLAWTSCWGDEEETRRWDLHRWTMTPARLFHESRPRGGAWSEHSFNTFFSSFLAETHMWSNKQHAVTSRRDTSKGIRQSLFLFFLYLYHLSASPWSEGTPNSLTVMDV